MYSWKKVNRPLTCAQLFLEFRVVICYIVLEEEPLLKQPEKKIFVWNVSGLNFLRFAIRVWVIGPMPCVIREVLYHSIARHMSLDTILKKPAGSKFLVKLVWDEVMVMLQEFDSNSKHKMLILEIISCHFLKIVSCYISLIWLITSSRGSAKSVCSL